MLEKLVHHKNISIKVLLLVLLVLHLDTGWSNPIPEPATGGNWNCDITTMHKKKSMPGRCYSYQQCQWKGIGDYDMEFVNCPPDRVFDENINECVNEKVLSFDFDKSRCDNSERLHPPAPKGARPTPSPQKRNFKPPPKKVVPMKNEEPDDPPPPPRKPQKPMTMEEMKRISGLSVSDTKHLKPLQFKKPKEADDAPFSAINADSSPLPTTAPEVQQRPAVENSAAGKQRKISEDTSQEKPPPAIEDIPTINKHPMPEEIQIVKPKTENVQPVKQLSALDDTSPIKQRPIEEAKETPTLNQRPVAEEKPRGRSMSLGALPTIQPIIWNNPFREQPTRPRTHVSNLAVIREPEFFKPFNNFPPTIKSSRRILHHEPLVKPYYFAAKHRVGVWPKWDE